MTRKEASAKERFVKAMRQLAAQWNAPNMAAPSAAIEAFADAECTYLDLLGGTGDVHSHSACRAALLKECGLKER